MGTAFVILVSLNIANHYFVVTYVEPPDAFMKKKISAKKLKQLRKDFVRWHKKMMKYRKTHNKTKANTGWKKLGTMAASLGSKLLSVGQSKSNMNQNSQEEANSRLLESQVEGGSLEMAVMNKRRLM